MKLYATVKSERDNQRGTQILKGHGGNDFVRVDFEVKDMGRVACVILSLHDGVLQLETSAWKGDEIIKDFTTVIKGEKQKAECEWTREGIRICKQQASYGRFCLDHRDPSYTYKK